MTTLVLWHLGVTGLLAGAFGLVVLAQSVGDGLRRLRHRTHTVSVSARHSVEPRTVRTGVRAPSESAHAMASAAGAR